VHDSARCFGILLNPSKFAATKVDKARDILVLASCRRL
jgi:hypothetical protein